jgi:hypothetical protein
LSSASEARPSRIRTRRRWAGRWGQTGCEPGRRGQHSGRKERRWLPEGMRKPATALDLHPCRWPWGRSAGTEEARRQTEVGMSHRIWP